MIQKNGAQIIVDTLINHDVKFIFTVPGAKIDKILDELIEKKDDIRVILCRSEQSATFMAQGIGRLTGKPGVVLVTSGPGVSNLATGLVTANSESDPVLAIGGNVNRKDLTKRTHQSMSNIALLKPVTKFSQEVLSADNLSEVITNAYKSALSARSGAAFVSIPQDITKESTSYSALKPIPYEKFSHADTARIKEMISDIRKAKLPVLLLGMRASGEVTVQAIRELVKITQLPVVETFQGAGIISRELEETFFGRVGLFKNQPGDMLLDKADLVITVGFDPIEYDPETWNSDVDKKIYHIDNVYSEIDNHYRPFMELVGGITKTIQKTTELFNEEKYVLSKDNWDYLNNLKKEFVNITKLFKYNKDIVHPLQFMWSLRQIIDDEKFTAVDDNTIIATDIGSIYIWMARNFKSYQPRKLLFSNGMQTLGVALPWAIAGSLLNPDKKVISLSGDGGFLFTSSDLDTAVRENLNITHIIWDDSCYNMVEFQQEMKYGRSTAVKLGNIDFVKYAESFGAKGFKVNHPDEMEKVLREALEYKGVAVLTIPIDYSQNEILGKMLMKGVD